VFAAFHDEIRQQFGIPCQRQGLGRLRLFQRRLQVRNTFLKQARKR